MNLNKTVFFGLRALVLAVGWGVITATAGDVTRELNIAAPDEVAADANFTVTVTVSSDAGEGEQIGFCQMDVSHDGGRTWVPTAYVSNVGANLRHPMHLQAGAAGTEMRVRVRVAFRDGLAGDVDYAGAAIKWEGSWAAWDEPPAKSVVVRVEAAR
jgi:hypothetical protein